MAEVVLNVFASEKKLPSLEYNGDSQSRSTQENKEIINLNQHIQLSTLSVNVAP